MKKILITYLSKTGSTKEVAEEISKVLNENQLETDVIELTTVSSLADYSAVIIGAPINGMKWLSEAEEFVEKNKDVLNSLPTAYYFLSIIRNNGRKFFSKLIEKSLDRVSSIVKPIKIGKFGGYSSSPLPGFLRFLFGLKKDLPKDLRNWDEIKSWAKELADILK
ncbi:MAG: flavodoxin domain-containing protein [Spirochaetes bacterium]|nr:flavodoxin domain-containing protein [Spirochaetota bacterium]